VAKVPLFVITADPEVAPIMLESSRVNVNKASHFNVFKTVINVMGYKTDNLPFYYDASLTEPLSGERSFFTGNLLTQETIAHVFSASPF
jgi:hypothetical protein